MNDLKKIAKKCDQMYALLAMCIALCPTRLDENIHNHLREKYGDQLSKMQKGYVIRTWWISANCFEMHSINFQLFTK